MRAAWLCGTMIAVTASGCPERTPDVCPPLPSCEGAESSDREVVVVARLTLHPFPDLPVITHRLDGTVIARATTDADGCARVASEPGALVSVRFNDQQARMVTSLAPTRGRLTIFGERWSEPPQECTAGELRLTGEIDQLDPQTGHIDVHVDFGCDLFSCPGVTTDTLPHAVVVPGHAVGADGLVDIVVSYCTTFRVEFGSVTTCKRGGYRVERYADVPVRPDELVDETAGESPGDLYPASYWAESDRRRFTAWIEGGQLAAAPGLAADHFVAHGVLTDTSGLINRNAYVRVAAGEPRPMLGRGDFLPEIERQPFFEDAGHWNLRWNPPGFDADVAHLQFDYGSQTGAGGIWNLVLPIEIDHLTLPQLPEIPGPPVAGRIHFVDDDSAVGFEDFVAGELHLERSLSYEPIWRQIDRRVRTTTGDQQWPPP